MVRIALQLIFLFLSFVSFGQLVDNFSDNNLTDNVTWKGNVSSFTVDANQRLRLNAPIAGTSFLYTDYNYKDSFACSLTVKLEFNPSASNYTRLYFLIDNPEVIVTNGYFIQLGENGSDDAIRFYKVTAGQNTLLGSGILGTVNKDSMDIKLNIQSNGSGRFTIEGDHNGDGQYEDVFIVNDTSFKPSIGRHFGLQCTYTATRRDKFAFDNISIVSNSNDFTPPFISSALANNAKSISVLFNEALDKSFAENRTNYLFTPSVIIDNVVLNSAANQVTITLLDALIPDQEYALEIKNIRDLNGNSISQNNSKIKYVSPIAFGDLLISEVLFDPYTNQQDFLELYNNSSKDIDLKGFKISSSANSQEQIISSSIVVRSGTYIALSPSAASVISTYSPPMGSVIVNQNLPAMNNDRGNITITSSSSLLLDSFSYIDAFHTIDTKVKNYDGVSQEKIELIAGKNEYNWMSCELASKYATPGYINSLKSDLIKPTLLSVSTINDKQVILFFDDILNRASMANTMNYTVNNGIGQPVAAAFYNNNLYQVLITFDVPFSTTISNILSVRGVKDKNGNEILATNVTMAFGNAPLAGDIILSEILFAPNPGGEDFIEVYNNSNKNIELANLKISNLTNQQSTTLSSYVLAPKTYIGISKDTTGLKKIYSTPDTTRFLQNDLPSFNIDEGNVTLSFKGIVLDSFNYSEDLHHSLIDKADLRGISLEKVVLLPFNNSQNNWHSGAKNVNYATPGYRNSAYFQPSIDSKAAFTISDKVFTPNGDGDKDFLVIQYQLDEPGYVANAKIFTGDGYLVKDLAQNDLLGTNGILKWDGSNNDGFVEKTGIYIILGDLFSTNGNTKKFKLSCVLALP